MKRIGRVVSPLLTRAHPEGWSILERMSGRRFSLSITVLLSLLTIGIIGTARAQQSEEDPPLASIYVATSGAPVVVSPGIPAAQVDFPVTCSIPSTDPEGDPEPCQLQARVFFKAQGETWRSLSVDAVPGVSIRVVLPVPNANWVDYYVEVIETQTETVVYFPKDGEDGPLRYYIEATSQIHQLAATPFGSERAPTSSFSLGWGTSNGQVGMVGGDESQRIGPQALDVTDEGNIYLLDQMNQRVQVFSPSGSLLAVQTIPVGPLGDLVLEDDDSSYFVLDRLPAGPGSPPAIHHFDGPLLLPEGVSVGAGSSLTPSVPSPEEEPVSLRYTDGIVYTYGTPSDGWRPAMTDRNDLSEVPAFQITMPADPTGIEGATILRRVRFDSMRADVGLVGSTDGGSPDLESRIGLEPSSGRYFGELALVEPTPDGGFLVVIRTWTDQPDLLAHHEVIRIDGNGNVVDQFAIAHSEYAAAAPLSLFRLGGTGDLYELWSDSSGVQVRRFDL